MSLIRKIIIKEWCTFFAGAFVVLFIILTVATLVSGFLRSSVTPMEVILSYLIELPSHLSKIIPVSGLVASLFSINKLKNRSELTAIFASGFSPKNYVSTLLVCASIVSFIQLVNSSYIDPFFKEHKEEFLGEREDKFSGLKGQGLKASASSTGKLWYKTSDYYFSFAAYDKINNALSDFTIIVYNSDYLIKTKAMAESITFVNGEWVGENIRIYDKIDTENFPTFQFMETSKVPLKEKPADFEDLESDITTLNIFELSRYIKKLDSAGINTNEYKVMWHEKISGTIICIIFTLLSANGIFNPNRRSSSLGKGLAFVFVFTLVYLLVTSYFIELGKSSKLDPFIASYAIPFAFFLILLGQFTYYRKLR